MASTKHITPVSKKNQPDDNFKFQPLPEPSGAYPYRLPLQSVIPETNTNKIVFHLVGDTGSIRSPDFQRLVAGEMARQFDTVHAADRPQFLFHLGDIVYNHGETSRYNEQFFTPYAKYPAPIFAIPGNHDSDINPDSEIPYQSLDAFRAVFCDAKRQPVAFALDKSWQSMSQPNIYWTLQTPLANIIGLYSNVPKYGVITSEQRAWFIEELKVASTERPEKALIVCLHHAPFSADTNHGSSLPMIEFLESAFDEAGVIPDIVFSGHVHNYQRFNKHYADNKTLTYIVAGAGGYDELHSVATIDNEGYTNDSPLFADVKLKSYCDTQHGFVKVSIKKSNDELILTGEYYAIAHPVSTDSKPQAQLVDSFSIPIS